MKIRLPSSNPSGLGISKRDALLVLVGTLLGEKAMTILANILALVGQVP